MQFTKKEWKKKIYIITKALFSKKHVKLIGPKKFTAIALNLRNEVFIVYMALLETQNIVYLSWKTLILLLLANKTSIKISKENIVW